MKVGHELVQKLATLAKLNFDAGQEKEIINDLSRIIVFVDKLKELNVDGVEPLIYMNDETNILRRDNVKMEITKHDALKNAPLADSDYFKVPKVIKK